MLDGCGQLVSVRHCGSPAHGSVKRHQDRGGRAAKTARCYRASPLASGEVGASAAMRRHAFDHNPSVGWTTDAAARGASMHRSKQMFEDWRWDAFRPKRRKRDRVGAGLVAGAVGAVLMVGACTKRDDLYCTADMPCAAGLPYCDLTGAYAPDHIANTCIEYPWDAAPPPGQLTVGLPAGRQFIRRGGDLSLVVELTRGQFADGDVTIALQAPPPGVTADPLTIPRDSSTGTLVLHATTGASFGPSPVDVVATVAATEAHGSAQVDVIGRPGELDTSFGNAGAVTIPGTSQDVPIAAFAQGDKLVVVLLETRTAGTSTQGVLVTRVHPNGAVDTSFATNGSYFEDFASVGIVGGVVTVGAGRQSDGRLVLGGSGGTAAGTTTYDSVVVRLMPDGQVDTSLPPKRLPTTESDRVALAGIGSEDELVFAGATAATPTDAVVIKLNSNGGLDPTFGRRQVGGAGASDSTQAIAALDDGSVVVLNRTQPTSPGTQASQYVAKHGASGPIDTSFGTSGIASLPDPDQPGPSASPQAYGVASDGASFYVTGTARRATTLGAAAIWRLLPDGRSAPDFGTGGLANEPAPGERSSLRQIVKRDDGGLVGIGGTAGGYLKLVAFMPNGDLDPNFGGGGVATDSVGFTSATGAADDAHRLWILGLQINASTTETTIRRYFY